MNTQNTEKGRAEIEGGRAEKYWGQVGGQVQQRGGQVGRISNENIGITVPERHFHQRHTGGQVGGTS